MLLRDHAEGVRSLLARCDEWAEQVATGTGWVITHAEPNASNVVVTGQGMKLVDWSRHGSPHPSATCGCSTRGRHSARRLSAPEWP